MRSRPHAPRRFRVRPLTQQEQFQLVVINEALDAGTEFGLELAPRERLLTRIGEMTALFRLLKNRIGL